MNPSTTDIDPLFLSIAEELDILPEIDQGASGDNTSNQEETSDKDNCGPPHKMRKSSASSSIKKPAISTRPSTSTRSRRTCKETPLPTAPIPSMLSVHGQLDSLINSPPESHYVITNQMVSSFSNPAFLTTDHAREVVKRWYEDGWDHLWAVEDSVTIDLFYLTIRDSMSNSSWSLKLMQATNGLLVAKFRSGLIPLHETQSFQNTSLALSTAGIQNLSVIQKMSDTLTQHQEAMSKLHKDMSETITAQSIKISTTVKSLQAVVTDVHASLSNKMTGVCTAIERWTGLNDASTGKLMHRSSQSTLSQRSGQSSRRETQYAAPNPVYNLATQAPTRVQVPSIHNWGVPLNSDSTMDTSPASGSIS